MPSFEALLADGDALVLVGEALDYYRGMIESNRETAVSEEEEAYFRQVISTIDRIVRALRDEEARG